MARLEAPTAGRSSASRNKICERRVAWSGWSWGWRVSCRSARLSAGGPPASCLLSARGLRARGLAAAPLPGQVTRSIHGVGTTPPMLSALCSAEGWCIGESPWRFSSGGSCLRTLLPMGRSLCCMRQTNWLLFLKAISLTRADLLLKDLKKVQTNSRWNHTDSCLPINPAWKGTPTCSGAHRWGRCHWPHFIGKETAFAGSHAGSEGQMEQKCEAAWSGWVGENGCVSSSILCPSKVHFPPWGRGSCKSGWSSLLFLKLHGTRGQSHSVSEEHLCVPNLLAHLSAGAKPSNLPLPGSGAASPPGQGPAPSFSLYPETSMRSEPGRCPLVGQGCECRASPGRPTLFLTRYGAILHRQQSSCKSRSQSMCTGENAAGYTGTTKFWPPTPPPRSTEPKDQDRTRT